jgi:hypothetical protein
MLHKNRNKTIDQFLHWFNNVIHSQRGISKIEIFNICIKYEQDEQKNKAIQREDLSRE